MEMIGAYRRAFSLRNGSCIGLLAPYMAVLTLLPQLRGGPHKTEPFVRACQALAEHAENFPVAPYILAMLKALDMEHNFGFPEEARLVIQESRLQPEDLEDIPMEMQIPVQPRSRQGPQGLSGANKSESVGDLLARWTGLSSEESLKICHRNLS
jgi:hypothetical protein